MAELSGAERREIFNNLSHAEKLELIKEGMMRGYTRKDIAAYCGLDDQAAEPYFIMADRDQAKLHKFYAKRRKSILAAKDAGIKTGDISEAFAVSRNRVLQILREERFLRELAERKEHRAIDQDTIENAELSVRSMNCLLNAGITTVTQLRAMDRKALLTTPNFGKKSLQEVERFLKDTR